MTPTNRRQPPRRHGKRNNRGRHGGNGGQRQPAHGQRLTNQPRFIDRFFGAQTLPPDSHAGLVFDRYLKLWRYSAYEIGLIQDSQRLLDQFASQFQQARASQQDHLELARNRQQAAIDALTEGRFRNPVFVNHEPLALSLGNEHPIGNGASFDAALGAPILAGSSIKGLMRAAHTQLGIGDARKIDRWLGPPPPQDNRQKTRQGELTVFDALPTAWPRLAVDIINSHHGKYYIHNQPPTETESPVPVFFLTVANNLKWRFLFGGRHLSDAELDEITELLTAALAWFGLGGKTAVGYGRMHPDKGPAHDYHLPDLPETNKDNS